MGDLVRHLRYDALRQWPGKKRSSTAVPLLITVALRQKGCCSLDDINRLNADLDAAILAFVFETKGQRRPARTKVLRPQFKIETFACQLCIHAVHPVAKKHGHAFSRCLVAVGVEDCCEVTASKGGATA